MSGIKNVANLSLDSIKVNSIDADMVLISASPPTHPPGIVVNTKSRKLNSSVL